MDLKYCITVPVYNEEDRIVDGITRLSQYIKDHNLSARIDIADNGSTDATKAIATDLCRNLDHVTLTHVSRKGVGLALQESWATATEPYVGYIDVDLSTDLKSLITMDQMFSSDATIEVINGSRLLPKSVVIGRTLKREVSSRGLNLLLKVLLRTKISDGMCGFKFVKTDSIRKLTRNGLNREDWFFNAELLIRAEWMRMNVQEIAVTWSDDPGGSKVKIIPLAKSYFLSILNLRKERNGTREGSI